MSYSLPCPSFDPQENYATKAKDLPNVTELVPKFRQGWSHPPLLSALKRTMSHRTQISPGITTVYKAIMCPKTMASLALPTACTLVTLWRKWPRRSDRGLRELGSRQEWRGLSPSHCLYVCNLKVCVTSIIKKINLKRHQHAPFNMLFFIESISTSRNLLAWTHQAS